jgi:predicted anti-sigma-YlaC factor YlaD
MLQRLFAAFLLLTTSACSIKRLAINKLGNALANGGTAYQRDEDPELVAAAVPFGLKLYESLLEESPKHTGLLLAAASGFTEYAYAFVDLPSSEAREFSLDRADAMRDRARKLYLRAHRYGLRGLDSRYPGISKALEADAPSALLRVRKTDIGLLYWTAASLGLAISVSKDDPDMIGQLPFVEAVVRRASELDEAWGGGSIPEFMITLEASRAGAKPEAQQKAMRTWYARAVQLGKGRRAGAYVALAENAAIAAQDAAEFRSLLEKALAVDTAANPDNRLANLIAQRRARWLLAHQKELILEKETQ